MNRIRLAVVGLSFGGWMLEHELLTEAAAPYIDITAVCDLQEQKAREWGARLNVTWYKDLEELLENPEIEAVALFSGPNGRAELIERIIRAGKHVMTTKPFEIDSSKALQVLELARSLGRVVHLNSPSPVLRGDLLQVRSWIDSYELGQPVGFRADTTCSYREQYNGSWYDDPDKCPVAPIFRLGIYLINDVVRFFGEVERVSVMQSRIFTGRPTPDNAQLSVAFRNGALGTVFASFCVEDRQYYRNAFVMNFERGTIYRNMGPTPEQSDISRLGLAAVYNGKQVIETFEARSTLGYQWDVFHAAVRGLKMDEQAYNTDVVAGIRLIELMKEQADSTRGDSIEEA